MLPTFTNPFKRSNGFYYVQPIDPITRRRLTAKSTGVRDEKEAFRVVARWEISGIPRKAPREVSTPVDAYVSVKKAISTLRETKLSMDDGKALTKILMDQGLLAGVTFADSPGAQPFVDFLESFWTYETSPFVKEKLAFSQRIGKTHCDESLAKVRRYYKPYFAKQLLSELTLKELKDFALGLCEPYEDEAGGEVELSFHTRNHILAVAKTALNWAERNKVISDNPAKALIKFSGVPKARGILTLEEAQQLFALKWDDERFYLANLLSATSGMRAGEVVGLQTDDFENGRVTVNHSWLEGVGLKEPKNGRTREITCLPDLQERLLDLSRTNPHENKFIFWGAKSDVPMVPQRFASKLREMLVKMKVGDSTDPKVIQKAQAYWADRNILFHSWRHFFATHLEGKVGEKKARLVTGHLDPGAFQIYVDHVVETDLDEVKSAVSHVFGSLVSRPCQRA